MELIFLNANHEIVGWVDSFIEILWIERYDEPGEFKLVCSPTPHLLSIILNSIYVSISGVPRYLDTKMRIETIRIEPGQTGIHTETGNVLTVSGRSLESMLKQRIVWYNTLLISQFQLAIFKLLDENIITPTDPDRILISNIRYDTNLDERLLDMYTFVHLQGEYVSEVITSLCRTNGLGWSLLWDYTEKEYVFKLQIGVDRSYNQTDTPTIAFTTELENLLNPIYEESGIPERNVCCVVLSNIDDTQTIVSVGDSIGLERKEMFLRASLDMTEEEIGGSHREEALKGKGINALMDNPYHKFFDGEADATMYEYGRDYGLGDIIQTADSYGHEKAIRITEMIFSQNSEGIRSYPRFKDLVPFYSSTIPPES